MKNFILILTLLFNSINFCFGQTPQLESRPGSPNVLYLDFDGDVINNPNWYSQTINALPSTLSAQKKTEVFKIVVQKYEMFDVNVTTKESVYNAANTTKRSKCVITPTNQWYGGAGGVAFVGAWGWEAYQPGFTFENMLNYDSKYVAYATAHEVGHQLALNHHAKYDANQTRLTPYHQGIGSGELSWGPIMGAPYYVNVCQWITGSTVSPTCAQTFQDDFQFITNYIPFLPDESTTINNAKTLTPVNNLISDSAMLTSGNDVDFFKVVLVNSGTITANVRPTSFGNDLNNTIANMDTRVSILNSSGTVLLTDSNINKLNCGLISPQLSAGTYYIRVGASGNPNFTDFCMNSNTRYGSVGKYYLTGTVSLSTQQPVANFTVPAKSCVQFTVTPINSSSGATSYSWNFGSGASPQTSTSPSPSVTYSTSGIKTIQLTVSNSSGSNSISKTINIGIPAIPAIIGPNNCPDPDPGNGGNCPGVCQGSTVTLTAQPSGDNGSPYTYYWTSGETTQSIVINNATPFTDLNYFSRNVTITNSFGCTSEGYKKVTVLNLPNATITGPSITAPGNTVTFSVTAVAGQTYLWSTGATTSSININTTGNYSVTVTNSSGCTASASKTLTVTTCTLQVSISGGPLCVSPGDPNQPSTILTANPTGGPSSYTYLWSGGGTTQSKTITSEGTYTVTVTSGSCSTTQSKVVTTSNNPVYSITNSINRNLGSEVFVCKNSPFTFTVSVAANTTVTWSPATMLSTTSGSNVTVDCSIAGSTPYTITINSLTTGCTSIVQRTVNVVDLPNSTISGPNTVPTTLSVPSVAGQTYLWSTGATTSSINVTQSGTYFVTVTKNRNSTFYPNDVCTSVGSKTVSGTGCSLSAILSGNNTICSGTTTTFTATPSGGSSPYTYSWSSGQTTQNVTLTTSGTYTVTVTDNTGCTTSQSRILTVNTNPTVTITGNNSICLGNSTTLTAGGAASYSWNTGSVSPSINVSPSVNTTYIVTGINATGCSGTASRVVTILPSVNPTITGSDNICSGNSTTYTASTGASFLWSTGATTSQIIVSSANTYSVTVTSSNGCVGTTSKTLTVNQNPTATITGNNTFCSGSSTTLSSVSSIAGSGSITGRQWRLNGTNITGATNTTYSANSAGTYTVVITNSNGCSTISPSFSVTSISGISVSISGNNSICPGSQTTFTASPSGNTYLWSNSSTTQSITISSAGTYNVTVTDVNGCSGTATRNLTVITNPTITITGNNSICLGNSTTLTANGATSYVWNTNATTASITVSPTVNTTYTVTGTFSSGCTASTSLGVTVNSNPTVNIGGSNSICQGGSVVLTASGATTYLWNNGLTTTSITVSPTVNTTYTVTGTNATGCSGTASKIVTVNANPTPNATNNGPLCVGSTLNINCDPSFTTYSWTGPNGFTSSTKNNSIPNAQVINSGTYNLTVTNSNGCTGTSNTNVQISTNVTNLSITSNSPICIGSNIQISVTGANTYSWTGPNGFTSIDSILTINNVNYSDTGYYVVNGTSSCGLDKDSVNITTLPITLETYDVTDCRSSESASFPTLNVVSYSWSPSTNVSPSSGVISQGEPIISTYSLITTKRTYILTVTTDNGCTVTDTIFTQRIIVPANAVANTTKTTANLNWTSAGDSELYQLRYKKLGTNDWIFTSSTINSKQLTNLLSNTTYVWQVRAKCNQTGSTIWSNFSKEFLFTTKTN